MSDDAVDAEQRNLVNECCAKLQEHFDSVQIFVTRHEGGKSQTISYEKGGGNFYARLGQIIEWQQTMQQNVVNHVNQEDKKDEGE